MSLSCRSSAISTSILKLAPSRIPTRRTSHFIPPLKRHLSSPRKLFTSTVSHPGNLNAPPPPPRNSNVPDTSIAGAIPKINDLRPPNLEVEVGGETQEAPKISLPEQEAQKSKATLPPIVPASSETVAKSKRPRLRPRKAAMTLTPTAIDHLRALLEQPDPKLIRVGVRNRGCSGLAYHLEYVEKPGTFDELVEQNGVKVLIDSKALFSIIGSEMDWVEDKLNQRFVFKNPNIKEQCGCGESFMV